MDPKRWIPNYGKYGFKPNYLERLLAIDPGDRYVGIFFREIDDRQGYIRNKTHWSLTVDLQVFTPYQILSFMEERFPVSPWNDWVRNILIVEKFMLYGKKARAQTGSQMKTSQLIGMLKQKWDYMWDIKDNSDYKEEDYINNSKRYYIYKEQTASMAKQWPDERLENLGFLEKNFRNLTVPKAYWNNFHFAEERPTKHSKDALRHAIYFLNQNDYDKKITPDKLYMDKWE